MSHTLYRATLALLTPLGTPLAADTLFGQICWALREAKGEAELTSRLAGYTCGEPWLVVSDGFPSGFLPKPTLPQHFEPQPEPALRKTAKSKRWIPVAQCGQALAALLASAADDSAAFGAVPISTVQPHNTLNRLTGTTGEGAFAPYTVPQTFHAPEQRIDVYVLLDDARTTADETAVLLRAIGASGFGRDASVGLGKFSVQKIVPASLIAPGDANAFWTLGPCAPQGQGFDGARSYWRVLTRFGRHGNAHALAGNPFKTPVLLAATGAVFVPEGKFSARPFVGQGLGGNGRLSKADPATVHQGYAPVLPIAIGTPSS